MSAKKLLRLPDRLRQLRIRRDMSQRSAANQADMDQSILCAIEKGRKVLGAEQLERIAAALDLNGHEVKELQVLAEHDQVVSLVAQSHSAEDAELVSLTLQAKAVLSPAELAQLASLIQKYISAKRLLTSTEEEA